MKKVIKRWLSVLLVLTLSFGLCAPIYAANNVGVVYTTTLDQARISASDKEQTVVMTVSMNKAMDYCSLDYDIICPEGVSIKSYGHESITLTSAQVSNSSVSWASNDASDISTNNIAIITFAIPANFAAGEYTFGLKNISLSNGYGLNVWETAASVRATLTVEGVEDNESTPEAPEVTPDEPDVKPIKPEVTPEPEEKPVEPEVTPEEPVAVEMPFTDVANQWYAQDVQYVYENGLMNGVGDGTWFAPNLNTSRGMIVTILWRLARQPAAQTAGRFSDVAAGAYYEKAVAWAAENGIVTGYAGSTKFGPNDNITREQFAVILHRYAKFMGYDVSVGEDTNILSYKDAFSVSDYAFSALRWTCGAGLINGANGYLMPAGNATRAQAAAILHRFCENVK